MPTPSLLEGFLPEAELAREAGVTTRTLRKYRQRPDGYAYLEWGGQVWGDVKDFRERFLPSLVKRPNPRRGRAT